MDECLKKHLMSIHLDKQRSASQINENDLLPLIREANVSWDNLIEEPLVREIMKVYNVKRCATVSGESGCSYNLDLISEGGKMAVNFNFGDPKIGDIIKFLTAVYDIKAKDWLYVSFPVTEAKFSSFSPNIIEAKSPEDALEKLKKALEGKGQGSKLQQNEQNPDGPL
jgi:hypothetical protein